ncbi:MAG: hypothetical protein HY243_01330 [Proteobacteria bacterium]|nr:hypothetical protein [Pseudomonadota bacterium]
MKKADIVNALARKRGCGTYLEIATPGSGKAFGQIDRAQLDCQRLLYRCPEDFSDGLPVDFRTTQASSAELVLAILDGKAGRGLYDIVFVDSFHIYRASMEDILGGYCLVRPGGLLIMHDCKPPNVGMADPYYRPGFWCGVSHQAFVDFTLPRRDVLSFTVDCDFGCGVVFKPENTDAARDRTQFEWFCARRDEGYAFDYFERHPAELLRLKSVRQFVVEQDLTWNFLKSAVVETTRALGKLVKR